MTAVCGSRMKSARGNAFEAGETGAGDAGDERG